MVLWGLFGDSRVLIHHVTPNVRARTFAFWYHDKHSRSLVSFQDVWHLSALLRNLNCYLESLWRFVRMSLWTFDTYECTLTRLSLLNISLVFTSGGNIPFRTYNLYCGDWFKFLLSKILSSWMVTYVISTYLISMQEKGLSVI